VKDCVNVVVTVFQVTSTSEKSVAVGAGSKLLLPLVGLPQQHLDCSSSYFFFDSFSFTLNFTIFLTKSNGIGLSSGNWIVPVLVLKEDNSFLKASIPDEPPGNKLTCFL